MASSDANQQSIARVPRGSFLRLGLLLALAAALVLCAWARGRGYKTRALRLVWADYGIHHYPPRPAVTRTRPENRQGNVLPDAFVAADVDLPFSGNVVDPTTLNGGSVRLYRTSDRRAIPAVVNTSGGGDAIVLRPMQTLDTNTQYTFEVTPLARDTGGHAFAPYTATFWTAAGQSLGDFPAAFTKVALPGARGQMFTCVSIGPDHKLYASTLTGKIFRYPIQPDGTLREGQEIETVNHANGAMRLITGMTFDPASTAGRLILWVSHGQLPRGGEQGALAIKGADDWTGKISRLSGADLEKYEDMIVHLPRAWKDHLNDQPVFGPDGALYFCQAANTAMGAPDHKWGFRPERLLTAAILRVDVKSLEQGALPLDVQTGEGGHYDPFSPGVPLTIYASGTRNSFDLVWHGNGHLYAGINGSAAYGNSPGTPAQGADRLRRLDATTRGPYLGPMVPGINNITETEDDMLFKVEQGAYYGHPNPARAEYVLNGGNAGPRANPYQVADYPLGTQPDRNWHPAIFSFGKNLSPCGAIEYQSNIFGGALRHKLLFVRYSGGDDIIALGLDSAGDVSESITGIEGFTHFVNPVDLIEDPANGNLYVAEFGAKRITLVRPICSPKTLAAGGSHRVCLVHLPTQAVSSGQ
ncbi:MAG TPA: Ig-like domain-containing protein [Tepidisphaeraceae bacterium]|nr:Ig-like domain-containing protein [Tepidisphaeraceae bacterium]